MLRAKTDTEVLIGGKIYTVSGDESEEYLQRIASYINGKISEYSRIDNYKRQTLDTQNVLLQLNIADELFKAKKQIKILEDDIEAKDKELYDAKHDLITTKIKLNTSEELVRNLETANSEYQKRIVELEALLANKESSRNK
ncbi:MAG: cell division protein ZapA [Lachnospiraceae bacterium]|nr:cell division protein ZapA [Lachnospiraceae bacterium]